MWGSPNSLQIARGLSGAFDREFFLVLLAQRLGSGELRSGEMHPGFILSWPACSSRARLRSRAVKQVQLDTIAGVFVDAVTTVVSPRTVMAPSRRSHDTAVIPYFKSPACRPRRCTDVFLPWPWEDRIGSLEASADSSKLSVHGVLGRRA